MVTKKDNKKYKNSVIEVSLDDLDLDLLKEVGVTDEEIQDFNKDTINKDEANREDKDLNKKKRKSKKEKNHNNKLEKTLAKFDNDIFDFEEDDEDNLLELDYDNF
jgi:hypothetical protein